jgi:lysozyme family protein
MSKSFDQLVDEVIGKEGGYSNHKADRGGPTRWGVTEQTARAHGYRGEMKVYPREMAVEVYRATYWTLPGYDRVAAVFPAVAAEMFDTGVNMGVGVPGKMLQRALNLLNRGATDYPDIAVDNMIGKGTIAALRTYKAKRGAAGELVLLATLNGFQLARYAEITESRPANEAFFFGWVANRVAA